MRRDVVGLGIAIALCGLTYGSQRMAFAPRPPAAVTKTVVDPPAAPSTAPAAPLPPLRPSISHSASSIVAHVKRAAHRYRVPESLVAAVVSVESEFNPRAVSRRGAVGLMQLMPTTAALLGVRDSFDPAQNVDGGAKHLRDLLDRFANDVPLALAAYNAGTGAVEQHGGIPPYPETQAFVARVMSRFTAGVTAPAHASAGVPVGAAMRVRMITRMGSDRLRRVDAVVIPASLTEADVRLPQVPRTAAVIAPLPPSAPPERMAESAPSALTRSEAP